MLLRRYGNALHSVVPNFDPNALTEISFRRDRFFSISGEAFGIEYEKVREEELSPESDGMVQSEAESELLARLEQGLRAIEEALGEGELLLVESEQGTDYPKVRDRKEGIIVEGENRLVFHWRVEPPLRVGIYRRRAS
jgi:hypothetical protein